MMQNAAARLMLLGFSESQRLELEKEIKEKYVESLRVLFTNRDTAEKFKPFKDYIALEPKHFAAKDTLLKHANYQVWQFESAPVLGKEPFALKDVYIESECGVLTWDKITRENEESQERVIRNEMKHSKLDAFDERNGGRHKLLDVVMNLLADETQEQPIIIQGVAGSGKTSFTLRLCNELVDCGLIPIRIRLRDVNLSWNRDEALPRAVRLSENKSATKDVFLDYKIFDENGVGEFEYISRYVLILDGWDEISTSASESFKERVEKIIKGVIDDFLRYRSSTYPVKIILTGRPSEQITNSELLRSDTPVLTLRPLTKEQLTQFVINIQKATQADKIDEFRNKSENFSDDYFPKGTKPDIEDWQDFDKSKFDSILKKYNHKEKRLEVLGLPLLAHLTAHLIKHWKHRNAADLVENETTLYRNLINLTCLKAGKAETDKNISTDDTERFSTVRGTELRKLLWATAAAMSVFDDESISHNELGLRIKLREDLRNIVGEMEEENWLSSLLISFYFKAGIEELGCEFSHKSFREYLYAEAIINELREYGKKAEDFYRERKNEWEDFPTNDERFKFSRNLARLLSPQWLKDEVIVFLRNLIDWEIARAKDSSVDKDIVLREKSLTTALSIEQWQKIRDGLADVWSWWNDGVHLRLQAGYDETQGRDVYKKEAFVNELIHRAMPLSTERTLPPSPSNVLDAHLGEAFCYLNIFLHNFLRGAGIEDQSHRKHQSIIDEEKRFKPSANSKVIYKDWFSDFYFICGRINSTGDRPRDVFPRNMNLSAIDLNKCLVDGLLFDDSYLGSANLSNASLDSTRLFNTRLDNANLNNARLFNASLFNASLDNANLDKARLFNANLDNTSLSKANLNGAELQYARHLTEKQILLAFIDEYTNLPKHLEHLRNDLLHFSKEQRGLTEDSKDIEEVIDNLTNLPKRLEQIRDDLLHPLNEQRELVEDLDDLEDVNDKDL